MKPPRANAYRDTWSGTVDADRAGDEIRVAGWVHRRRDHGGLIFVDLRDRSGLLQLVFHPETASEVHERAHDLRAEDVITAHGAVVRREAENVNPDLPTGEVELEVADFEQLGDAATPPFQVDEEGPVDELTRMRHVGWAPATGCCCATAWRRRCAAPWASWTSSRSRRRS